MNERKTMTPDDVEAELAVHGLLDLVTDIARRHGATLGEVCGRDRRTRISVARQAAWYALRHHSERTYSYPDIGAFFGRDHSTVMSGVRAYAAWLARPRVAAEAPASGPGLAKVERSAA